MAISRLNLVSINFDKYRYNEVLLKLFSHDDFHPELASKFIDSVTGLSVYNQDNLYEEILVRLNDASNKYNFKLEEVEVENNQINILKVKEYSKKENAEVIPLCVKIEEELSSLDDGDKKEMLEALGLSESGLDKVIKKSYDLLGLMSFLTAGEPEVRAWTIKKGTKAPEAAGKIHSDIQRGFIKAEVVSYDDLMKEGSMLAAKEKGLVRSEGKEYIMQDGDIVLFKFNV